MWTFDHWNRPVFIGNLMPQEYLDVTCEFLGLRDPIDPAPAAEQPAEPEPVAAAPAPRRREHLVVVRPGRLGFIR